MPLVLFLRRADRVVQEEQALALVYKQQNQLTLTYLKLNSDQSNLKTSVIALIK